MRAAGGQPIEWPSEPPHTGEGGMGGFLKRWLYDMRARELPIPSALLDG